MPDTRLHKLHALGQSPWIDYLSRDLVQSGELERLIREDAIRGVTSNPTIFQKAISSGNAYDEQLRELAPDVDDPKELFIQLATRDVRNACDVLRGAGRHGSHARDGYVSIEVDPDAGARHRGDDRPGAALPRADRPPQPLREDPGDEGGPARDRGDDLARAFDQRHADLLARALRGGRRGLHPRARAAASRPAATRPGRRRSRASSSRASTPRPTGGWTRSAHRDELKGKLAIANAKLAYERYRGDLRRRALGARSPPRARSRSSACGRPPRRRTRTTATSCTSRS